MSSTSLDISKWANKNINIFQLLILLVGIVAGAAKMYHDLASHKEQVDSNKIQIAELKKKAIEDNKIINELKTNTAVMRSEIEGIRRQNTALLIKFDKLYDKLIDKGK
jgi:predicted amino acid racemase